MRFASVSLAILMMAASPVLAKNTNSRSEPNWEAEPLYTTLELAAGFDDDPRTVAVEAGGDKTAEGLGTDCSGFISWDKPDVDINYEANDEEKLHVYVKAETDTTLVIYTPDRKWVCGDDISEANLNPSVTFNNPQKGNYNIWIGTYEEGESKAATLYVSELDPPK